MLFAASINGSCSEACAPALARRAILGISTAAIEIATTVGDEPRDMMTSIASTRLGNPSSMSISRPLRRSNIPRKYAPAVPMMIPRRAAIPTDTTET